MREYKQVYFTDHFFKNYIDFRRNQSTNDMFNPFSNHFETDFIVQMSQNMSDKYCGNTRWTQS